MKKKVSLLIFLVIGSVVLMASYRSEQNSRMTPTLMLTSHSWKFDNAESLNNSAEFVINTIYNNAQYNFTNVQTYQGEFFEKPIQGVWQLKDNQLVLNGGTSMEERMEIAELEEDILKVRVIERGASVTLTFR